MRAYFAIVGCVLGVFGILILMRRIHLFFVGVRAPAVFSKWEMRGPRRPAFHPVVRFIAHDDGKEYEVTSLAGGRPQPKVKEKYEVIYPLGKPQKGLVYSFLAYWAAPFAFFVLSFVALYAAYDMPR